MANQYYGDYGIAEAAALRKRKEQSIANTQSASLGQMRGTRNLADITKKYEKGFQPLVSSFAKRGLISSNVQSGISRQGLSDYAESLQKDLGSESTRLQTELNNIAQTEMGQQNDLQDYLNNLNFEKTKNIMNTATDIKSIASY